MAQSHRQIQQRFYQSHGGHKVKDLTEGLDYISTWKYVSYLEEKYPSEDFVKNLIRNSNSSLSQNHEIKQKGFVNKQEVIELLNRLEVEKPHSESFKPLIQSLFKFKANPKKGNQQRNQFNGHSNEKRVQEQAIQPIIKTTKQKSDENSVTQPENKFHLLVIKDKRKLHLKTFVKYPSSSLLRVNPELYKQKVQLHRQSQMNDKNDENNQQEVKNEQVIQSPRNNQEEYIMKSSLNGFKNKNQFKKKRNTTQPNKGFTLREIQTEYLNRKEIKSAYCTRRNRVFKNKTYFNDNVTFLKKKQDTIRVEPIFMNDQIPDDQQERLSKFRKPKSQQKRFYRCLEKKQAFQDLIQMYNQQKHQQGMVRQNYFSLTRKPIPIQQHQTQSKLYSKCWMVKHEGKNSFIQKLKQKGIYETEEKRKKQYISSGLGLQKKVKMKIKEELPKFITGRQYKKIQRKLKTIN